MSVTPPLPSGRRTGWPLVVGLILAVGATLAVYFLWLRPARMPSDLDEVQVTNQRGVGHMERFEYAEAAALFEAVVRAAPDWTPGWINLGIALLNQDTPQTHARARDLFTKVLTREPNNRHAHYCLGIICSTRGPFTDAYGHFGAAHRLDPADAHTLLRLGLTHPAGKDSPEAREYFEEALRRNPYLNAARYNLALALGATDPARAAKLFDEHRALMAAVWETESGIRYSEMGRYAEVIGRDSSLAASLVGPLPLFEPLAGLKVTLSPGANWATVNDRDKTQAAAQNRFGGAVSLFDYNADGRPDVFLLAAVVERGQVRNLLLRNDGDGAFRDVTAEAGLARLHTSLGASAGDFDNDGRPDLMVTGVGGQHLYRNQGNGTFEDVSAASGLDQLTGVCLACGWVDVDQDGDLDLVVCRYSEKDATAFDAPQPGGEAILYENVGVAPPGPAQGPAQGLSAAFRRSDRLAGVVPPGSCVSVIASDLDSDRDLDLLALPDRADPVLVENDRLLRFKRASPAWLAGDTSAWNGGLILDANHDERSDLFLVRAGAVPLLWLSKGERDFVPGVLNSPALKQAVTADVDMDGWPDVVGLSTEGRAVLLHNQGEGRLRIAPDAFGLVGTGQAIAVADLDGDDAPDLLVWGESGLALYRNRGNGNAAVRVVPTGRRDKGADMRTNADGIGTWVVAQAGRVWSGMERGSTTTGRGQSLLPTALGIGKHDGTDVLRLRWPDAVIQAELGVAAGLYRVAETNRKGTSCPVLMAWDGTRFVFVTDFLGAGALGESGPDGSIRPPRPEESVKIEPGQLVPRAGELLLKIAEPMDEVLYLDHVRLAVLDHPADAHIYPDERFVFAGPQPSQRLLAFRTRHFAISATDHRGRDVTATVRDRDRRAVDAFATRSWLGYAEDHSVTLDFPDVPAGGKYHLVLAGWTDYPYPESMYAATRAGLALQPPVLERGDPDGKWVPVCDLGFPAGLPRVMTRELPEGVRGGRFRIRTNMQVYWDQIYLAREENPAELGKVTEVDVSRAVLAARGFMQEIYPDGRPPVAYDDAKTEPVVVNRWKGHVTRLGDVTDLLRLADDRVVLCGPGDEITVAFAVEKLPPLPAGWKRSFVLRARGYCKDTSTTTVTGGSVAPLPFRAMANYPDFGAVSAPTTDADRWHTRPAGGR